MINIRKPNNNPMTIIRAASGYELSNYEKRKLASVEENAQENKIEVIKVNGQHLPIDPTLKEVEISLGDLAFKGTVTPADLSTKETFFIDCEI